jgi:hypothetical protein
MVAAVCYSCPMMDLINYPNRIIAVKHFKFNCTYMSIYLLHNVHICQYACVVCVKIYVCISTVLFQ